MELATNTSSDESVLQLKIFGAKKDAWAVVTGASDGIGKEFALQLAGRGFNVLLVARTTSLLNAVGEEISACLRYPQELSQCHIEAKYPGVKTAVHTIDFAAADDRAYEALTAELDALDIGVLGAIIQYCSTTTSN